MALPLPQCVAEDITAYAVRVYRGHPPIFAAGNDSGNIGIYLGNALILTAAHVAGSPSDILPITIMAEGHSVAAHFVKAGEFDDIDISLLSIDPSTLTPELRALSALKLCIAHPVPGQQVIVVDPLHVAVSSIIDRQRLPSGIPEKFDSLIGDVDITGNSGSGVFDADRGCLLGIISRRIDWITRDTNGEKHRQGLAKYFVSADQIRLFVGDSLAGTSQ